MSHDLRNRANLIRSLFVLLICFCFTACAASATATPTPPSTQTVITVIATNAPTVAALATNTNAAPPTTAATSSPTVPIAPTLTLAPTTAPTLTLAPTQPPASPVPPTVPPTAVPLPPTATLFPATATTAPTEPPPPPTQAPTEPPVVPTQPPAPPPASFQPTELVTVFEGILRMGSPGGFGYPTDQEPQHDVRMGEFQIERYEVSNGQYAACVAAGICTPPGERLNAENYPVVNVTWNQADTYCTWIGRRLPNEAEWERAARGMDSWEYSWSNRPAPHFEWNAQFHGSPLSFCEASCPLPHSINDVNDGFPTSAPVDAFGTLDPRHDVSNGFNAQNMNGNVSEWTSNWYDGSAYQQGYPVDVFGPSAPTGSKVYRGGSWATEPLRLANRFFLAPDQSRNDLGFRCAR